MGPALKKIKIKNKNQTKQNERRTEGEREKQRKRNFFYFFSSLTSLFDLRKSDRQNSSGQKAK